MSRIIAGIAMVLFLVPVLAVAQIPPQPSVPPDHDNTLYETPDGSLSNGAGMYVFAGRTADAEGSVRRAVVHFDIYSVWQPSVFEMLYYPNLTIHVSQAPAAPAQVSLHRLLRAWGEGTSVAPGDESGGGPAEPDDATWIHTFYDTAFWTNPGSDYVPVASATITVDTNGYYTFPSTSMMEEDLQFWYCHPDSNFGWIIVGDEGSVSTLVRFDSRENLDPALRPKLGYSLWTCDCFCNFMMGDLYENGFIDSIDLGALIDALFAGGYNPECCRVFNGDLDCSRFTDVLDLSIMIDYLFAGGDILYSDVIQCLGCGGVCTGW